MSENKKHVHAELMFQYAQDALRTDKPYELWEIFYAADGTWEDIFHHPHWHPDFKYRRKPEMITVGKVNFPKPVDYELNEGDKYYTATTSESGDINWFTWCSDNIDYYYLNSRLIHLTEESAKQHCDALIKINRGEF